MNAPTVLVAALSGQTPPGIPTDAPAELWPYLVAIGFLATTALGMAAYIAGLISKMDVIHETHRKAEEERTKRNIDEFAKKDKALLDTSVEFAKLMERIASELATLNDRERERR